MHYLLLHQSATSCSGTHKKKNLTDKMLLYRMYPVVSMNGRVFLDRDVTIGGYKFPKNVGLHFPGLDSPHLKFLMVSLQYVRTFAVLCVFTPTFFPV